MCYFCFLTWRYKLAKTNPLIQCQTSFFEIYGEPLGDIIYKQWELVRCNGCVDRDIYVSILEDGARPGSTKGGWGEWGRGGRRGRWCRVIRPKCELR
jgi:hypothetical protein